jgi:hypothetical protein
MGISQEKRRPRHGRRERNRRVRSFHAQGSKVAILGPVLAAVATETGKRIYGAMKEGELDGQSIGYRVGEFTWGTRPNGPRRPIKTIKELPEISLVTFPMNELARTGAVKASDIRTVRDFEEFLREVGGFSHAAAKSIARGGFKAAEPEPSQLVALVASLRDVRRAI